MNVVILDPEPAVCVRQMCNQDICAAAYMYTITLSDALRQHYQQHSSYRALTQTLYPPGNLDDPLVTWAIATDCNYMWFLHLTRMVWWEYTNRYNKVHKCSLMGPKLEMPNDLRGQYSTHTCPPLQLPDKYQTLPNAKTDPWARSVQANRAYYIQEKTDAKWKVRPVPAWFTPALRSDSPLQPVDAASSFMTDEEAACRAQEEAQREMARKAEEHNLKRFLFKKIRA